MNSQPTPVLNHTASGSVPAKKSNLPVLFLGIFVLVCLIGFFFWKNKAKNGAHVETANQIEMALLFPAVVGNNAEGKVLWGEQGGKTPVYTSELMFAQPFDYDNQQREWRIYRGVNNDTGDVIVSSFVLGLAKTNKWEVIKGLSEAKVYSNSEGLHVNREAMFAEKAQFKLTHSGILTAAMRVCIADDGLGACGLALFALNHENNDLQALGQVSLDSARAGETALYEDKTTAQYLFQTGHHAIYDDVVVNYTYWVGERKRRYSAVWVYSDREKAYASSRYEAELVKNERFAGHSVVTSAPTTATTQNTTPERHTAPASVTPSHAPSAAHSTSFTEGSHQSTEASTPPPPKPKPKPKPAPQTAESAPEISEPVEVAPEVSEPAPPAPAPEPENEVEAAQ